MTYADRLEAAIARTANAALVGLDPHADSRPSATPKPAARSKHRLVGSSCAK
jgi:hypothetical protein